MSIVKCDHKILSTIFGNFEPKALTSLRLSATSASLVAVNDYLWEPHVQKDFPAAHPDAAASRGAAFRVYVREYLVRKGMRLLVFSAFFTNRLHGFFAREAELN
eukprot:tig00000553_g2116.t1